MTTKKVDSTGKKTGKLERGRFASLLAAGFVVEIGPAKKPGAEAEKVSPAPGSATPRS